MLVLLVGGCVGGRQDLVDDAERGGFFSSNQRVLNPVGFKFSGDLHVQHAFSLGVVGFPGSGRPYRRWVAAINPNA